MIHAIHWNFVCAAVLAAVWLYHTVAAWRGLRQVAELTRPEWDVPPGTPLPRVSIIVPACNEQHMIEESIRSLMSLEYPDYEVVAVDDRSTDATGEILDRLMREFGKRLKVVHILGLPSGWLGKNHAMYRGAQESTGEWILFTDADMIYRRDALARAVYYAEREHADHMVLLPTMLMLTFGERMMISFFQALFIFAHRPWKVRDPKSRDHIGVGAFNMIRRAAYEKIGTYDSMRLSVVDDMRLGEKVKAFGLAQRTAFGQGLIRIRWAVGARGVIHNLTKNFYAQLRFNLAIAVVAAAAVAWVHLGPWIGTALSHGWARAAYAVSLTCVIVVYYGMSKRSGISPWFVLMHPVSSTLMIYTLVLSTILTLKRGGVLWRGTFYPLRELKEAAKEQGRGF